jgi:signal transduction protein with GAF and PtsI domain
MKIEADHVEKESKAKIKSQTKILELHKQLISRQAYLNVFIGVVAALLIALAIVLVKINKHKQRLNLLLDSWVKERTEDLKLNHDIL